MDGENVCKYYMFLSISLVDDMDGFYKSFNHQNWLS